MLGLGKKIADLYHLLNVPMDSVGGRIRELVNTHMSSGLFHVQLVYTIKLCVQICSVYGIID